MRIYGLPHRHPRIRHCRWPRRGSSRCNEPHQRSASFWPVSSGHCRRQACHRLHRSQDGVGFKTDIFAIGEGGEAQKAVRHSECHQKSMKKHKAPQSDHTITASCLPIKSMPPITAKAAMPLIASLRILSATFAIAVAVKGKSSHAVCCNRCGSHRRQSVSGRHQGFRRRLVNDVGASLGNLGDAAAALSAGASGCEGLEPCLASGSCS